MTSQHYKDHLLDQLHNLRQGHMSIQNYIAIFKNLAHRSDLREHHSETITKFVWGLRPKIKRAMITGPYDLNTVEEAFDVALKLDSTFKTLINAKTRCSKCEGYGYYDYQYPSQCQYVRTVLVMMLTTRRLLKMSMFILRLLSIIEDILVDCSV